MTAQHQLFGIRMQVHLLVHPVGHRVAAKTALPRHPPCLVMKADPSQTAFLATTEARVPCFRPEPYSILTPAILIMER